MSQPKLGKGDLQSQAVLSIEVIEQQEEIKEDLGFKNSDQNTNSGQEQTFQIKDFSKESLVFNRQVYDSDMTDLTQKNSPQNNGECKIPKQVRDKSCGKINSCLQNQQSSSLWLNESHSISKRAPPNCSQNNQSQLSMIFKSIILDQINEGALICKLTREQPLRRQSEKIQNFKLAENESSFHNTLNSQYKHNQILSDKMSHEIPLMKPKTLQAPNLIADKKTPIELNFDTRKSILNKNTRIDPVYFTDQFFKKLPFYEEEQKFQKSQSQYQKSSTSYSKYLVGQTQSLNFLSNLKSKESQRDGSSTIKAQPITADSQVKDSSSYNYLSNSDYQSDSVGMGLNILSESKTLMNLTGQMEIMLNLKIYQPYFISHATIIQYEQEMRYNMQTKPQKYSITDILDSYYMKRQTSSRLFFKVNLNEDLNPDFQMLSSMQYGQGSDSLEHSRKQYWQLNKNTINNAGNHSSEMEEIKELHSERSNISPHYRNSESSIRQVNRSDQKLKESLSDLSDQFEVSNSPDSQEANQSNIQSDYKDKSQGSIPQQKNSKNKVKVKKPRSNTPNNSQNANEQNLLMMNLDSSLQQEPSALLQEDIMPAKRRLTTLLPTFPQQKLVPESEIQVKNSCSNDLNLTIDDSESSQLSQYYDQEITNEENDPLKVSNKKNTGKEKILYFEFEIKQINDIFNQNSSSSSDKSLTFLSIKDITRLVQNQQKFSDKIYQDAIENNYSHEQMTPLNPMINYSESIKLKMLQLFAEKLKICDDFQNNENGSQAINQQIVSRVVNTSMDAKNFLMQITSIEQSSKAMWYYNTNQIKRMKLKKNQLKIEMTPLVSIQGTIWNVLWPFEHQIYRRKINVWLIKNFPLDVQIFSDWKLYEIILFNIIQNAVKYNQQNEGDIVICVTLKPLKKPLEQRQNSQNSQASQDFNYVFETQVIDTGIGIPLQKQSQLFVPFLELKNKLGLIQDENHNIGLGLSCSKDLTEKLGGNIKIMDSQPGLTNIAFKFGVKAVQVFNFSNGQKTYNSCNFNQNKVTLEKLTQTQRPFNNKLQQYLTRKNLVSQTQLNNSVAQASGKNIIGIQYELNEKEDFRIGFSHLENIEPIKVSKSVDIKASRDEIKHVNNQMKSDQMIGQFQLQTGQNSEESNKNMRTMNQQQSFKKPALGFERKNKNKVSFAQLIHDSKQSADLKAQAQNNRSMNLKNVLKQSDNSIRQAASDIKQSHSANNSKKYNVEEEEKVPEAKKVMGSDPNSFSSDLSQEFFLNDPNQNINSESVDHSSNQVSVIAEQIQPRYKRYASPQIQQISQQQISSNSSNYQNQLNINDGRALLSERQYISYIGSNPNLVHLQRQDKFELAKKILFSNHRSQLHKIMSQQLEPDQIQKQDGQLQEARRELPVQDPNNVMDILVNPKQIQEYKMQKRQREQQIARGDRNSDSSSDVSNDSFIYVPHQYQLLQPNPIRRESMQNSSLNSMLLSQVSNLNSNLAGSNEQLQVIPQSQDEDDFQSECVLSASVSSIEPQLDAKNNRNRAAQEQEGGCSCQPKVLVVEDNEFNMMIVCNLLKSKFGIEPEEAQNGKIAYDMFKAALDKPCKCKNRAYKLIIMDIQMPIMDGMTSTEKILNYAKKYQYQDKNKKRGYLEDLGKSWMKPDPFCNIVALTSYTADDIEEKIYKKGMKKMISKPLDASVLKQIVQIYFNQSSQHNIIYLT